MKQAISAATALALVATSIAPFESAGAQTAAGMGDLIGARGSSAEDALGGRGYVLSGNNGAASMWWNEDSRSCVSMYVDDGRVQSIQTASASDCGKSDGGGGGVGAAIAGIAAVGLIAALASHHKNTDNRHAAGDHDQDYSRGYNDALYGGQYDNSGGDAYHEGYMAGGDERQNRVASNSSDGVRGLPSVARSACESRGDQYLNMPSGTSVAVSSYGYGNNSYEVTVAAGHYRARCTVDAYGNVSDMNPY
jgi:hypothetical protein